MTPSATSCEQCGRDAGPGLAFCLDCGHPLRRAAAPAPLACGACGTPLQPGFRFCGRCGARLGATPPPDPAPAPRPHEAAPSSERPAWTSGHAVVAPPAPAAGAGRVPVRLAALRTDGLPGVALALRPGETVCGRDEGAFRLSGDPAVSPRHARFVLRDGAATVEDLGSANGVHLRIRAPVRLGPGDELRVGRQVLRLERAAPAPEEPGASRPWGAADPGGRLRLVQLLEGGVPGDAFPLREGPNEVGRETGDVRFPGDRYVSARHARLDVDGEAVALTDLGSSNGTFVRISAPVALSVGDQLLVGTQLVRVDG